MRTIADVENHELQWQGEALQTSLNRGKVPFAEQFDGIENAVAAAMPQQGEWFAVLTRTHHEKRVAELLAQKEIQNFLPLYKAIRHWTHNRRVTLDLPLFPNYIFVNMRPQERIRILEVPGVVSLVSRGRDPIPLPPSEIESLRSTLALRSFAPHPYLAAGTRARIMRGPLAGMEGIVLRNKGGLRVDVTIELIRQSVAVEVGADELEACAFPRSRFLVQRQSDYARQEIA